MRIAGQLHLGHTEIEDFEGISVAAIRFEPDVVRLQIAMNNSMPVRLVERQADLVQKIRNQRKWWPRMGLLERRERLPVEEFHDEVRNVAPRRRGNSEIGDVDDIGMAQAAAGLRFPLETGYEMGVRPPFRSDYLHGHDAGGSEMGGQVNVSHAARAQLAVDAVFAVEDFTDHERSGMPDRHDSNGRARSAGRRTTALFPRICCNVYPDYPGA